MAAELENLINQLYEVVKDGWAVPLSQDKVVIERDRALDLIEELRSNLPSDIRMAAQIVEKRDDMLEAGKRDADNLRQQAEEAARRMVSETQIVAEARKKAKEIIGNAEIQARELRRVANEYCEDTLKRTEESMALSLDEIKKARQRFKAVAK
ncbi:MAG: hypothetical protein IJ452_03935 [Butyricicoccus sp.]|nr:hypothetical protein [Butyricicoccus sp.]MBQ8585419.1 hypothetical protein [Butyricicoccus sp.]